MEFKKPFYKLSEVMEMLQVSRPTLYREIKAGRLEAYVIAGEYRVSAEALEKLKYKPGKSQQPLPDPMEGEKPEPKPAIILDDEREQ